MKDKEDFILKVAIIICLAGLTLKLVSHIAHAQNPPPKISWMNDAVYYTTNLVMDRERMSKVTNRPTILFYTKDVVSTNKVGPWYFGKGDRQVEIGFRDDGMVIWRYRE